jgi:hypothetical protein
MQNTESPRAAEISQLELGYILQNTAALGDYGYRKMALPGF